MWGYNSQKHLVALGTIANMVVWDACFGEVVAPWIQGSEHNVCIFFIILYLYFWLVKWWGTLSVVKMSRQGRGIISSFLSRYASHGLPFMVSTLFEQPFCIDHIIDVNMPWHCSGDWTWRRVTAIAVCVLLNNRTGIRTGVRRKLDDLKNRFWLYWQHSFPDLQIYAL